MNKQTLKATIVTQRDNGSTYSDIAKFLEKEFGIKMSRQAIYGMYNRAKSEKNFMSNLDLLLYTDDVITYYALGVLPPDIKKLLSDRGINLTVKEISTIIDDNIGECEAIRDDIVDNIVDKLQRNETIENIYSLLEFKGTTASEICKEFYMRKATEKLITESSFKILTDIYSKTHNPRIVKNMINMFGFEFTTNKVRKAVDNNYKKQ